MEHSSLFFLELKNITDEGRFVGLASVYGNVDRGNDVVERGAFTDSLRQNGSRLPILWQHKTEEPIGLGILSDTPEGLQIAGEIDLEDDLGQRALRKMKRGEVKGLSIGYQVEPGGSRIEAGIRRLSKVSLYEVSVVTLPMNPRATVAAVKGGIEPIMIPAGSAIYVMTPESIKALQEQPLISEPQFDEAAFRRAIKEMILQ